VIVLRRLLRAAVLGGAALALGATAGCTGYSGSVSHQVTQWASQYSVISNDSTVIADVSAIRRSLKAGRLKDVTSNCAGLVDDAGTAYGNLPTPDNTLTNELNTAYQDFANAGGNCATLKALHGAKLSAALRTISAGVAALARARQQLASDGVG
jgi:hypothetical protein